MTTRKKKHPSKPTGLPDGDGKRAMRMYSLEDFVNIAWASGLKIIQMNWGEMAIEEPRGRARFFIVYDSTARLKNRGTHEA